MKPSFRLILVVLLSLPAWGQYVKQHQSGVTDITSYCIASTNCWKSLPSITAGSIDIGSDGLLGAVSSTSKIYLMPINTSQWIEQTSLGTAYWGLRIVDATHMYLLGAQAGSCTGTIDTSVYFWDGTHTPVLTNGCAAEINVGKEDGTLFAHTQYNTVWYSANQGSNWTQITGVSNPTWIAGSDVNDFCIVQNGQTLYTQTGTGTLAAFSPAPTGNVRQCIMNPSAPDQPTLFILNAQNGPVIGAVQSYNWTAGTWSTVSNMNGQFIAGYGYASLFVLPTSSNHPYHYNVYAGSMQASVTGSFGGCPVQTCPSGVFHDGSMQFNLPHGLNGMKGTDREPPTVNMNAVSLDYSAECDPLFGPPGDTECQGTEEASVLCELSLAQLLQGGGGPPPISQGKSVNGLGWDGRINYSAAVPIPGGYEKVALCGVTNACATGTHPTCPTNIAQKVVEDSCHGSPSQCNDSILTQALYAGCKSRSKAQNGSWEIIENYSLSGSEVICTGFRAFFKGPGSVICQ